jgi:hypothetical protein
MEIYNQLMELFGSCQKANIDLALSLMEGAGITPDDFLRHFEEIHAYFQHYVIKPLYVWEIFLATVYSGRCFVLPINDSDFLSRLPGLTNVWIRPITANGKMIESQLNLDFCKGLPNLMYLNAKNNTGLVNIDGLKNCPNLCTLILENTNVRDYAILKYLHNLDLLNARFIADFDHTKLSTLKHCPKLMDVAFSSDRKFDMRKRADKAVLANIKSEVKGYCPAQAEVTIFLSKKACY